MKQIFIISLTVLFTSCFHTKKQHDVIYPQNIEISNQTIQRVDSLMYCMDYSKLKLYMLGDYYIFRSILCGPLGRASNYYHFLLLNNDFSNPVYVMSLSSNTNNIWIENDSLFIDLLDFVDEEYDSGICFDGDTSNFVLYHTCLSIPSFTIDTISENNVRLAWKDLEILSSLSY